MAGESQESRHPSSAILAKAGIYQFKLDRVIVRDESIVVIVVLRDNTSVNETGLIDFCAARSLSELEFVYIYFHDSRHSLIVLN